MRIVGEIQGAPWDAHGCALDAYGFSTCRAIRKKCPESSGLPGGREPRDLLPAVGEGLAHFNIYFDEFNI